MTQTIYEPLAGVENANRRAMVREDWKQAAVVFWITLLISLPGIPAGMGLSNLTVLLSSLGLSAASLVFLWGIWKQDRYLAQLK